MVNWEERLTAFEDIEAFEAAYEAENGIPPYNVSHWNPERSFVSSLPVGPIFRAPASPFQYVFSYELPKTLKEAIAEKLGFCTSKAVVLAPSGTSANLLALCLLKLQGKRRLVISAPTYFQVPIAAQDLGLEVKTLANCRMNGEWQIEDLSNLDHDTDALWVTNPMHGFGEPFSNQSLDELASFLASRGTVVADECFCPNGQELARKLGKYEAYIGTYSPHKSVCMNGVKLGVIVTNELYTEALEQRSDIWAGPLTRMAIGDAEHFLSTNFDDINRGVRARLVESQTATNAICNDLGVRLVGQDGVYRSIYIDHIAQELEQDGGFLRSLIHKTGTSFIPLHLNYGPRGAPFGLRVNLARNCRHYRSALTRLLSTIAKR